MYLDRNDIEKFIDYLASQKGLSDNTVKGYTKDLNAFFDYFIDKKIESDLRRDDFRGFISDLITKGNSNSSINRILAALKGFTKYKLRSGDKTFSVILDVDSLKQKKHLPNFLFDREVDILLDFECLSVFDYRDKAIIELLFSTGLRCSEALSLRISDIKKNNFNLRIKGKGSKERIVIYNKYSQDIIFQYLTLRKETELSKNINSSPESPLFINSKFKPLGDRSVRKIIEQRIEQSALVKNISPHSLRHSFATSLLRNGADIRTVQMLLGHSKISSTQIYTHLTTDQLKDMHYKYHPHGK